MIEADIEATTTRAVAKGEEKTKEFREVRKKLLREAKQRWAAADAAEAAAPRPVAAAGGGGGAAAKRSLFPIKYVPTTAPQGTYKTRVNEHPVYYEEADGKYYYKDYWGNKREVSEKSTIKFLPGVSRR